jgi:hypothetical protein
MKHEIKPSFCANCTKPHAKLVLRGNHWLCPSCDPDSATPVRSRRLGPDRGYDVPEKHAPLGPTHVAFARAARRVAGPSKFSYADAAGGPMVSTNRPGFITVRVLRRPPGRAPLDAAEALATLRHEPWFAEVQHRGSTLRYHLFDRPDVDLAREIRSTPNADVMDALRDEVAGGRSR